MTVKRCILPLTTLLILAASFSASGQSGGQYEWVQPPGYNFGHCGGQGGDSVPGYANQRYYSRYECHQALDPRQCYSQGLIYQKRLVSSKSVGCDEWLQDEVRACQDFIRQASRQCDQLAK